ncbi:MAG TPA: hypothetical protein VH599_00915 [Ktedonobacterales bacterium]
MQRRLPDPTVRRQGERSPSRAYWAGSPLVAPPSRRPPLRQGERSPSRPADQQASVQPPRGTRERPTGARGRGNSRGKRPFPKGGGATSDPLPSRQGPG